MAGDGVGLVLRLCFRVSDFGFIMAGGGIDLVLRRLARFGCDPRRVGDDTWQAQCPVHGGPYYALLVSHGHDGSVSLNRLMNGAGGPCRGTAAHVLEVLGLITPAEITRSAQWPKTPRAFSRVVRRIAPQLRLIGIDFRFDRGPDARLITISNVAQLRHPHPAPGCDDNRVPASR